MIYFKDDHEHLYIYLYATIDGNLFLFDLLRKSDCCYVTFFFQQQPYVLKKPLLLGYNKQGEGHIETTCLGQIVVTVIFRPVLSVAKSGKIQ